MKVIGLTGRAGTGKDTVADRLVSHYGFVKCSFAGPLKAMLKAIGVDCENRETKELPHQVFGVSPRRMAQTLGTEWMRNSVVQDGWIRLAEQFVQQVQDVQGVVFQDVRFENEATFIRSQGTLIHIEGRMVEAVAAHESEKGIVFRDVDRCLLNNKTIDVAFRRLQDIMLDL